MSSHRLDIPYTAMLTDTDLNDLWGILPSENTQATLTKTGSQCGDRSKKGLSTKKPEQINIA